MLICLALPVSAQPCYPNGGSGVTVSVGVGVPNVYYQPGGYYVTNGYTYNNGGYYYNQGGNCPGQYYNNGYYPNGANGYYYNGYYPNGYNPGPGYVYTNGCGQRGYYPTTGYNNRYINGRRRPSVQVNVGFPVR